MPRRFPNQVHLTVSRLLKSGFLHEPPAWYNPVLKFPPIATPPRSPSARTPFDSTSEHSVKTVLKKKSATKHDKWIHPKPEEIVYLEDRVRRQFFKDHPFEAFRSKTIVESGLEVQAPHPIQGAEWTTLSQHGRNPTPDDAVQFAVNLHNHHGKPLSEAYEIAVLQFRGLRAEHDAATAFAAQEASYYGAEFSSRELDRGFEKEREGIATFLPRVRAAERHSSKLPWSSEWAMPGVAPPKEEWTRGVKYIERQEKGELPKYSPDMLLAPEETVVGPVAEPSKEATLQKVEDAALSAKPTTVGTGNRTYRL